MTDSEEGSMLVGTRASRKFGGPEMYSVASSAFTAGEPGNSTEKSLVVRDEGAASKWASLAVLSSWIMGHV
jgi:hypothetical protein